MTKKIKTLIIVTCAALCSALPAYAQDDATFDVDSLLSDAEATQDAALESTATEVTPLTADTDTTFADAASLTETPVEDPATLEDVLSDVAPTSTTSVLPRSTGSGGALPATSERASVSTSTSATTSSFSFPQPKFTSPMHASAPQSMGGQLGTAPAFNYGTPYQTPQMLIPQQQLSVDAYGRPLYGSAAPLNAYGTTSQYALLPAYAERLPATGPREALLLSLAAALTAAFLFRRYLHGKLA